MEHIYSVLCEKSSIDQDANTASLLTCLEELGIFIDKSKIGNTAKISVPIQFQLYSFWILEDKEAKLRSKIEIIDPKGNILHSVENEFSIKEGAKRFRSRINFNGLPITEEGTYIFRLLYKEGRDYKKVSDSPLDVKITNTVHPVNLKPR